MKKTCIIVDDEMESLNKIRILVEQTGLVSVLGLFNSPTEAVPQILLLKPDLVLMDMQMPELLGTEAARVIQKNHLCKFIFITAHPDYALESFDVDVIHYLLKPVSYASVFEALTRFLRFCGDTPPGNVMATTSQDSINVALIKKGEYLDLALSEISYLQSQRKLTLIYCKDGREIQVRESLKTLEKILPEHRFIKAQRSYIINLDGIADEHLTARYLILPYTKMSISISREARQKIKDLLRHSKAFAH